MVVHEAIKEVLGQPGLGEALPQKEEDIWNGQKKIISLVDLLCVLVILKASILLKYLTNLFNFCALLKYPKA